ncbi:MAG: hypothetical protein MZV70_05710 [Desulfobacterales bacterium]|nr:hypothetical protein [Desulfobacterales bacterium]
MTCFYETGYRYDSSLNPFAIHDRYGKLTSAEAPEGKFTHHSGIIEFPMPMESVLGLQDTGIGRRVFQALSVRAVQKDGACASEENRAVHILHAPMGGGPRPAPAPG